MVSTAAYAVILMGIDIILCVFVYSHMCEGKSGILLLGFAARPEEHENLTAKLIGAVLTTLHPCQ